MLSLVNRSFAKYYKMKSHSGLKKRLKIAGGLNDRTFWHYPVGKRHLNECKSSNNLNRKRNPK